MASAQEEFNELMRNKERRTAHPEDDDDGRSFLNMSDDDDEPTPAPSNYDPDTEGPRQSMSSVRSSTIPLRRYGANTGPKGVISDAQDFRDSRRSQRLSANLSLQAQALNLTKERSPAPAPFEKLDEEDEDLDAEDDYMHKWRQSRLRELQNGQRDSRMHSSSRTRRLYGGLTTVDGEGYLDAVDNSPSGTVVVVYIYDDYSQVSDLFENCIRTLAGKHQNTRFVKLHYEDAQMEPAGVPAVIAYRGGEKFAGLVPVINELPDDADLSALTLETVMRRHQILT